MHEDRASFFQFYKAASRVARALEMLHTKERNLPFALQVGVTILPFRFFAKLDRLVSPGPDLMSEYVRMELIRGGDCTPEYPNSVARYPPFTTGGSSLLIGPGIPADWRRMSPTGQLRSICMPKRLSESSRSY